MASQGRLGIGHGAFQEAIISSLCSGVSVYSLRRLSSMTAADSEGPKAHISESVDASQALAVSGKALLENCNSV